MKHEWRKNEKDIYLPKNKPELIEVPEFGYFTIEGSGNPNSDRFAEHIGVLYALSYAVKMSPKKGIAPEGYFDYTVYPLEGVWDLTEEGKNNLDGKIDKDQLVYKLMIRQPDFVSKEYAEKTIERVKASKPNDLLAEARFERISDGLCVQILHLGSYDSEPESFAIMEEFASKENLKRESKVHKEIYLTDARKVAAEKLKTVLRFKVLV